MGTVISHARWALCAALVACVPATSDPAPKGGVGIVTAPSPATRGEPFVTSDGWTVTVEMLAVQMYLVAVPDDGLEGGFGGTYTFSAQRPEEFIVRAVPQGKARTTVNLATRYVSSGPIATPADGPVIGPNPSTRVPTELDARFDRAADDAAAIVTKDSDTGALGLELKDGPSIILVARAEKDGKVVRLDVAIAGNPGGTEILIDVRANELTRAPLPIAVERLFRGKDTLLFEDFARADTNADGVLSIDELRRVDPICTRCSAAQKQKEAEDAKERTPMARLGQRVVDLFTP